MSATFAFISGAIAELLAGIVVTGFQPISLGEAMQFGIYRLLIRTLSFLILLVIVILTKQFRKSSMALMTSKPMLALCILPIVSILIVQQFTTHIIDTAYVITINEIIPMLSIIVVNIFIFILVENIMRQNEKTQDLILIKTQSDAQQKHIKQLIDNHQQIRQMSHDFKYQIDALHQLCDDGRCEDLRNSLAKLSNRHNISLTVRTGNIMLDTILSSKKDEADKHGIDFKFNLNIAPELSYISMDICILLGNAIDNSLEACMRSNSDKKFIEMDFTADSSRFLFHMRNSIGEVPKEEGAFLKTQKKDSLHHGIGLQSIKQISNKLGGDMTYEYDDEQFAIWIYLTVKQLSARK